MNWEGTISIGKKTYDVQASFLWDKDTYGKEDVADVVEFTAHDENGFPFEGDESDMRDRIAEAIETAEEDVDHENTQIDN